MKDGFKYFSLVLIAVLLIKVSAFHVYEEHDAVEDPGGHCELCVIAIDGLQFEGITPSPIVVPESPVSAFFKPERIFPQQMHALKGEAFHLFSRPPPAWRA